MVRFIPPRITIVSCCLLLGLLPGCTRTIDPNEAIASVNETNIQRLANLYFTYQMKHGWKGPGNEAEFKKFLGGYNPAKLTRIGIDPGSIDELFINERDGEPFKIRYSVVGSAMGSSEAVIFESVGEGGKRLVGFLSMEQREVDEAEYDNLWAAKASSKQSSKHGLRER
jgi:hypothetical protein